MRANCVALRVCPVESCRIGAFCDSVWAADWRSSRRLVWARENLNLYERKGARYPGDLRDAERVLIVPQIPPAKRGGAKRQRVR